MKRLALLLLLALGILLLALAGWIVQGVRWTLSGGRRRRTRLAAA
jgi:hypothetical protein